MSGLKNEINCNFYDSRGNTVLNDEKLLEIVQNYPILYDKRQKMFGTKEYDEWVWTDISQKINFLYGSVIQDFPFSGREVYLRWQTLTNTLRKMYQTCDAQLWEIFSSSTKQSIIFFKRYFDADLLEETHVNVPIIEDTLDGGPAVRVIQDNASLIDELPIDLGRKLETEILDLILETELTCCTTVKSWDVQENVILKEVIQFLNAINYKKDSTSTPVVPVQNNSVSLFDEETPDDPAPIDESVPLEPSIINEPIDDNDFSADIIQIDEDDPLDDEPLIELLKKKSTEDELSDEPIAYCRQVPLGYAKFFIRPCVVRLQRLKYIEPKRQKIKEELFY